jgi:hypothetical protein
MAATIASTNYGNFVSSQNYSALRELIQEGHDVQAIYRAVVNNLRNPQGFAFLQELIDIHGVNIQVRKDNSQIAIFFIQHVQFCSLDRMKRLLQTTNNRLFPLFMRQFKVGMQ